MGLLLYDHPLSPYAQKVRIMLREKGLPFEARLPDGLGSGEDLGYSGHNPRLEVPALVTAEGTLFDSTVILEYLEDQYPDPPLRPAAPIARAQARTIEEVCDTHYEAITWAQGEMRFFGRGSGNSAAMSEAAARDTTALQSWLGAQIGDDGWLCGESFGWADLAAAPFVTMSQIFGLEPEPGSPLEAWVKRVRARPSVAETIAEAAAADEGMAHYSGLLEQGGFRRQFRDHRLEWMVRSGGLQVLLDGLAKDNVRFNDLGHFVPKG